MDITIYLEEAAQVSVAFIIGAIIGLEREFRSKPASFRTMILISVGYCIFTILSKETVNGSTDRIAGNIVTGIGFIGAGVIFKEGISVNGLTTAAFIWVTAALGMAVGYHNYPIAIVVSTMVVVALFVLEPVLPFINNLHKVKDYRIRTIELGNDFKKDMETFFISNDVTFRCMKVVKESKDAVYLYHIGSPKRNYDGVNNFLPAHKDVRSFEV